MRYKLKAYFCRFGLTEMLNRFFDEGIRANIEIRKFNGQAIHYPGLRFEADIETDSTNFYTSVKNVYCAMDETTLKLCQRLI